MRAEALREGGGSAPRFANFILRFIALSLSLLLSRIFAGVVLDLSIYSGSFMTKRYFDCSCAFC